MDNTAANYQGLIETMKALLEVKTNPIAIKIKNHSAKDLKGLYTTYDRVLSEDMLDKFVEYLELESQKDLLDVDKSVVAYRKVLARAEFITKTDSNVAGNRMLKAYLLGLRVFITTLDRQNHKLFEKKVDKLPGLHQEISSALPPNFNSRVSDRLFHYYPEYDMAFKSNKLAIKLDDSFEELEWYADKLGIEYNSRRLDDGTVKKDLMFEILFDYIKLMMKLNSEVAGMIVK